MIIQLDLAGRKIDIRRNHRQLRPDICDDNLFNSSLSKHNVIDILPALFSLNIKTT